MQNKRIVPIRNLQGIIPNHQIISLQKKARCVLRSTATRNNTQFVLLFQSWFQVTRKFASIIPRSVYKTVNEVLLHRLRRSTLHRLNDAIVCLPFRLLYVGALTQNCGRFQTETWKSRSNKVCLDAIKHGRHVAYVWSEVTSYFSMIARNLLMKPCAHFA